MEKFVLLFVAGVDGLITVMGDRIFKAGDAFFRGGVHGFEKNFEPKLFVLPYHLRQTGLIDGETFFPALFVKFFFSGHLKETLYTLTPPSPIKGEGRSYRSFVQQGKVTCGRMRSSILPSERWPLACRCRRRAPVHPRNRGGTERNYT
jgi:hypothetical protein